MEKWLGFQHFDDDEDLQNAVTSWLRSQVTEIYKEGIRKLMKCYDIQVLELKW